MNKDVTDDPIVVALEPNDEGKRVLGTAIRICESQHRALHLINVVGGHHHQRRSKLQPIDGNGA